MSGTLKDILYHGGLGIVIGIRIATLGIAGLLVVRSLAERFMPASLKMYIEPIALITDTFVLPVRYFLPERIVRRPLDYSPLVAALIILLVGLGVEHLFESIFRIIGNM